MHRRKFMGAVASAVFATGAAVRSARSQPRRVPTVGVLWHAGSEEEEEPFLRPFREALRELGYVEGRSINLEQRFPAETPQLFHTMAADLVSRRVDILVAVSPLSAVATKRATSSIPIVFVIHPNPVEAGLVTSLARPEANITGFSNLANDLSAKQLEMLREMLPAVSRIGVITNSAFGPVMERFVFQFGQAISRLNLQMSVVDAQTPQALEAAFAHLSREGIDAVFLGPDSMLFNERARLGQLAALHRLPVIALNEVMVRSGMLMYYGPNFVSFFRGAAGYVDRILKGSKPGDLPVQLPTKFDLTINVTTARMLGKIIPPTMLARADEVIE